MRSVNEASQALSGVVQSRWKRSSKDASKTTLTTVTSAASKAAKSLLVLRRQRSGDLDVERAAGSVLGKLMALEMAQTQDTIDDLSNILVSPSTRSLLSWLPLFTPLPSKHTDSLLTRTYTALTKLALHLHHHPARQRGRTYALRCLIHTSPGTIEATTFWDQVTRFATAFAKATPSKAEEQATRILGFCEHWTAFAKRAGDISILQKINGFMQQPSSSQPSPSSSASTDSPPAEARTPQQEAVLEGAKYTIPFHRLPATAERRPREEAELARISGKVDRALEKLRRQCLKFIEANPVSVSSSSSACALDDVLRCLLSEVVGCLHNVLSSSDLSASFTRDLLTRSIDTLFILSRTKLNVTNPQTFVPAFEHLTLATTILNTVPTIRLPTLALSGPADEIVDIANYTRSMRYGSAVPFLVESCNLGGKALRLPRPRPEQVNEAREKEWTQLEEQLFRRWELLGVCYSKNGDRKHAYDAFKQAIHAFPYAFSGLLAQSDVQAPDALFGFSSSQNVKQLVALVDRVSYMAATSGSLGLNPGPSSTLLDPSVAGALLERQLDSLEPSRWKEGVRCVFIGLLKDALRVYKVGAGAADSMPIRRSRILVRCMEFLYRDQAQDGYVKEIGKDVEGLASMEAFGRDSQLCNYIPQYRVSAHLWIALHAHRRVDPEQHVIMAQRTEEACRIIKDQLALGSGSKADGTLNPNTSQPTKARKSISPKVVKKIVASSSKVVSPKRTRTTRSQRAPVQPPAAPRKAIPTRILQPVSVNVPQTPPRRSLEGVSSSQPAPLAFDNFDKFLSLLQLSARILGFLSLILPKARLLDMTRKLAQRHVGATSDGYILASLDLAHQYVALGKLKRATSIFNPALEMVRSGQASGDIAVQFLLRFSESLAVIEDVPKSSTVYIEALQISDQLDLEQKGLSTQQRIHARTRVLELAALASYVFGLVQYAKGDITASLEGLLQSLRLWNRAVEALVRLNPPTQPHSESDPFDTSSLKEAPPATTDSSIKGTNANEKKPAERRPLANGLEWRISEGLLATMFALTQAYFLRGSAREAEYFARQAAELAQQLNAPGMASHALARQGEVQLHMGLLEDAQASLVKAAELLKDVPGIEAIDVNRLKAECEARNLEEQDVHQMFDETVAMLEELDAAFRQFDNLAFGPRKSLGTSPGRNDGMDVLAPELLASLLSQRLWFLRDDVGDVFNSTLEKLLSLSSTSPQSKAEENALLGRLTLHGVYGRFRSDMFLSSLTESTIAVPLGMSGKEQVRLSLSTNEIVDALASAEEHFWAHLGMTSSKGNVIKVREAAKLLTLIGAFRTSLGDKRPDVPSVMAGLLDCSAALTLHRDMLDAIIHKFPPQCVDDLQWPLLSGSGSPLPRSSKARPAKFSLTPTSESDDEEDTLDTTQIALQDYWTSVRDKYRAQTLQPSVLSASEMAGLPASWTVINIAVTPDKSSLFISRQQGGSSAKTPLIFCIPLKGRRDHGGGDEDEHLTFEGAIQELKDIVRASDECTKIAINIKADDDEARSNWWKERGRLDVRMRELLENIEYCWLGAFKTVLSPRSNMSPESISELRAQFEKIFHRGLHVKDKKPKLKSASAHRKTSSAQMPVPSPSQFALDDTIVECFSTLSPKCRDEELEDLVYFVLDLYQFHGVPVAIAEVDIDLVVVDLRTVLEEYTSKVVKERQYKSSTACPDEHLFLVLDRNVQGLPWESMPILRGRSVSRIPSSQFLHDRITYAKLKRQSTAQASEGYEGAVVDPRKGFFILNPSGDLSRTEERFRDWAKDMKTAGWDGVIGENISEQQFVNALKSQDLVVYFGHGGGEQYIRSHRIRSLPTCAATMLWGCSSGALRDMGDFDRTGTPYNYMLAGCPTLVANLWDVTDKDIDKISQAVFDKLGLSGNLSKEKNSRNPTSIVTAVSQSRNSCKLKYLTGAAPVVYGIPFYI
ncbi:peptidase family C50-domain-containing protein [Gymnopilus junonius]|uniref:separase n=1 Tax=Gymnopilus junonius TaxID=109634 RepID=A0A9P5TIB3_GYMJU|nr:peptidase family C50-domain-containing protein [Gymnopilus junonius]